MDAYVLNHVDARQLGGGLLDPFSPGSPTPNSTASSSAFSPSPTPSTPASRSSPSPVQPSTTSSTSSAPSSVFIASTSRSTDSSTSATAQNSTTIPQPGNIPTVNAEAPSDSSFLRNKVASGLVFTLIGVVSFVFLIFAITFFFKRRRNRRLHQEAISFDPYINHEKGMYISGNVGHGYSGPENKHDPAVFLLRPRANDVRTPFTGSSPQP